MASRVWRTEHGGGHLDHIGMPLALTNESGEPVWVAGPGGYGPSSRPYGDITPMRGFDDLAGKEVRTNLRLPGQYDDGVVESLGFGKLFYNWHRWYAAQWGRYVEPEPLLQNLEFIQATSGTGIDAQDYVYARDNPGGRYDPDGNYSVGVGAGVGGAVGGAAGAAAGAAVGAGVAISAGTIALICATTGNYYDFCRFWFPANPRPGASCGGNPNPPNLNDCLNGCAGTANMREDLCRRLTDPWARQLCWASVHESESQCRSMCLAIFTN